MYWNYRIVRYADGNLGLHEVYYDEHDKPVSRTEDAPGFTCGEEEGEAAIVASLEMALRDARNRPVLDDALIKGNIGAAALVPTEAERAVLKEQIKKALKG